ncbi:5-formyltetrahydrofolate cyclo-ligase [Candidatus Woesearchaeota archaeon]|nr:5-formyltetrahydrofolate cyclo-ligase [Candidatus Woesearchaeota archaeon]
MKDKLRKNILKKRKELNKETMNLSKKIIFNLIRLEEFKNSKSMHCYMSNNNEVDTIDLIKKFCYDKTIIIPPQKNMPLDTGKDVDIVIIPGIAFDKSGNRLGYGSGFYDIFLQDITSTKVALAYEFQIFNNIPSEPHDITMDYIITEKRIINCKDV